MEFKLCIKENYLYTWNKLFYNYINSKRNFIINEVNWNILVTLGKEIKRDSMISLSENRLALFNK